MSSAVAQPPAPAQVQADSQTESLIDNKFEIHISNLARDIEKQDVQNHFAACGEIKSTRIIRCNTYAFGFIKFSDIKGAQEAIAKLDASELNGNVIKVAVSDSIGAKPAHRGVRKLRRGKTQRPKKDLTGTTEKIETSATTAEEQKSGSTSAETTEKGIKKTYSKPKSEHPRPPRRPRPDGVEVDNQVFVKGLQSSTTDEKIHELFKGLTINKVNRFNNYVILEVPSKEVRDSIINQTKVEPIVVGKRRVAAKPAMIFAEQPKEQETITTQV